MTEQDGTARLSRRRLLRGTTVAAALAATGLPLVSCTTRRPRPSTGPANVRVSGGPYGVHVEPSVAVDPGDRRRLLAACQVSPTADPRFIATYLSPDAGATWSVGGVPALPGDAGTTAADVTVAFDARGRGYVCATTNGEGRGVFVWRTDDGGRSFSAPVPVVSGEKCDHPWLAVGAGRTPAERNVYVVWEVGDKSGLGFARSANGAESFGAHRIILDDGGVPSLAAGPNGLVLAACEGSSGEVIALCSTDAGESFGPAVSVGEESSIGLPGRVSPVGSPAAAIASDGSALYVTFTRHQQGAVHADIMVAVSRDSGRSWSPAVSATPDDAATYFQPNLTVDQAGRVVVSAFALANGRVDVVALVSQPAQLRFGPPLRVTTAAFDPAHSPTSPGKRGAWWIGDYQGIASGDGAVHLVWNDTRTGKLELFGATVHP